MRRDIKLFKKKKVLTEQNLYQNVVLCVYAITHTQKLKTKLYSFRQQQKTTPMAVVPNRHTVPMLGLRYMKVYQFVIRAVLFWN